MKLYTGSPFWQEMDNNPFYNYPTLNEDIECDVVIVGGGIAGALCSYYMNQSNIDTVLIDKRHFGSGSTMINSSLLHYEIDTNLHILSQIYDKNTATRYFQLCRKGLYDLKTLIKKTNLEADYVQRRSLNVTKGFRNDLNMIKEYYSRRSAGFKTAFVDRYNMKKVFNLPYSSGIFSYDGGEINPYLFTKNLIKFNVKQGLRAYEHTELIHVEHKKGYNIITTSTKQIKAKKVIFATGYEANSLVQDFTSTTLNIAYTLTTKPIANKCLWKDCCLIWEANHPYRFIRSTTDNRIVIGGFESPYKGQLPNENQLKKKCHALFKKLQYTFPDLYLETEYCSAGIFASTEDKIGYVGEIYQYPNCYFLLGYGTNGILYSVIGSQILRDLYLHGYHQDASLFSFYR
jgi:glycine/D-amino acid oxidase-like deaminating enzyme